AVPHAWSSVRRSSHRWCRRHWSVPRTRPWRATARRGGYRASVVLLRCHPPEQVEDCVLEVGVAGHGIAAEGAGAARGGRECASGLGDEGHECTHVVEFDLGI